MLHRKIEKTIADWIRNGKKALLIDGARQVGKTFIIRQVLNDEGCEFAEFNLLENTMLPALLAQSETVDDMIANLSLFADKPLIRGKTVIFFDEIQEFKELATRIKFWVDEGSFRYILSGSLLGVELKNIRSAPVGYLQTCTMYPLDFEEFLQVYNYTEELRSSLRLSFTERKPVNSAVHERASRAEFNEIDCVIYLHDGHDGQDAGQKDLLDACDIQNIPYATNIASAEILIVGIDQGYLDYRTWTDSSEADSPEDAEG